MGKDHPLALETTDGCLQLEGALGNTPVTVTVTPYSRMRMIDRDFSLEEILELLALPISQHRAGQLATRREVTGKIGPHTMTVVYERQGTSEVVVINVLRN